jgi:bacterioferritin
MGNDTVIKELNAILKGEQMAIASYSRFMEELEDDRIKNEFQQIQQDHKGHAERLYRRIQELGGTPDTDTGFAGVMASVKMAVQGLKRDSAADVLKKAYDGEDKGIAMVEEIKKGDLDEESLGIVNSILNEEHGHLSKMAHMLSDYEYKQ